MVPEERVLICIKASPPVKDSPKDKLVQGQIASTSKMSERKVLTKYYPPDFDPSKITRTKKAPGPPGPKTQTVRLMAPFSMKCTTCGEYIYKGRKFNARKETTDEKYYNIAIFRFYIRCTRCSGMYLFHMSDAGSYSRYSASHITSVIRSPLIRVKRTADCNYCSGNHIQNRSKTNGLYVREGCQAKL